MGTVSLSDGVTLPVASTANGTVTSLNMPVQFNVANNTSNAVVTLNNPTGTGNFVLQNAPTIGGNVTMTGNLTVSQNITVTGTTSLQGSLISDYWIQRVTSSDGAVRTFTTVIPFDDTIPQNTEGDEYTALNASITPTNANSKLLIELTFPMIASNAANETYSFAIFQQGTANALVAGAARSPLVHNQNTQTLRITQTAGAVSQLSFNVRVGPEVAGEITTVNGIASARKFGGVCLSSLSVTEFK